MISMFLVYCN